MPQPQQTIAREQESGELPKLSRIYERHPLYDVDLFISGKSGDFAVRIDPYNDFATVIRGGFNRGKSDEIFRREKWQRYVLSAQRTIRDTNDKTTIITSR